MSVIATAVKHLLAAGVTGDALVAAIADMEANMPLGPQAPERSKGALRTERWRERKAVEASQDVTERHAVTESVTGPLSPDKSPPDPQKLTPNPGCVSHVRTRGGFPKPDFADPQHWADFLENRKRKRRPNTATAHAKLLRDVEKWTDAEWPPGRIIEHAAASGWAGIYNPRGERDQRNGHQPKQRNGYGPGEYRDPILDDIFTDLAAGMDTSGRA